MRQSYSERHRKRMQKMRELAAARKRPAPLVVAAPPPTVARPHSTLSVQFHAPWALWGVGICTVWRRMARALSDAGAPVHLTLDPFYGPPQPRAAQEVADLLRPLACNAAVGAFPTAGDQVQAATIERLSNMAALTTMVERDRIGPLSVAAANRVAQWWLPCEANLEAFRRSGVQAHRLHRVHVPFFPNDPHLALAGRVREPGPTHFYRIGVVDQRKDQARTVLAFLRAFRPGEALLTIKTTHLDQDLSPKLDDAEVRHNGWDATSFHRDVRVVHALWDDHQLLDLHRRGDVYLSLSHGEGWDMPGFDALLSGNRMVYTESGGPQEFAGDGDLLVPTTTTVPCAAAYKWEPDARWVDFSVDDVVKQMREAHEHPLPKAHRRSWAGFTAADVGALMKELLQEARGGRAKVARPPSSRTVRDSLAIVSLFRQCPDVVDQYRRRLETLDWPVKPHVVCVEGDSTDETPELLDAWARENDHVHVLHHSLGNPLFGSTLNPVRLRTLATVSNVGMDYVARNLSVEYVLFLTSDLTYSPDLARRLRATLEARPGAGLVAPMVWRHNGSVEEFYDTWAFRHDAAHRDPVFDRNPSRAVLLQRLGGEPRQLQSVGSVLFCRAAAVYAGVRFTPDLDVVGFSTRMREAGYTVWADPGAHVQHPRQTNTQEVRAQSPLPSTAQSLLRKWTSSSSQEAVKELVETYTLGELQRATQQGPAEAPADVLMVYQPNSVPHGVASHLMFLRDACPDSAWVPTLQAAERASQLRQPRTVVLQVQWGCQPTHEALTPETRRILTAFRARGTRVVVNYHHAEPSPEWLANLRDYREHSDLIVHHADVLSFAGTGVYFPLPVPTLRLAPRPRVGGLAFMGFADPSRRIDQLVAVAERLERPIFGYGPRLARVADWYDTRGWTRFRPVRSYMDEHEGASELARHSVALLARSASSRAYSSASARFCMAAGLPVVVDHSRSYEDLRDVATLVDYEDHEATDAAVHQLLDDSGIRNTALERQRRYAERYSFKSLLVAMGVLTG